ncbi:plasmid replication DNA-binding protein [Acinetobacter baumannii]|uniref:plasmid replication DNA-binding protein n=1 Tax=Acinetobacter baumannii TaxID=470 RepID=UPI0035CEE791
MAKLSLSEVSKQFSIDRSTIYRAVKNGRLSRSSDGSFDISEVVRCFGEPSTKEQKIDSVPVRDELTDKLIKNLESEVRKYQEREERLLQQIDRMQTLLELKTVAPATATQQQDATARNTATQQQDATGQLDENIEDKIKSTHQVVAAQQQHAIEQNNTKPQPATLQNIATQQPKKRGLFNRVVTAIFDN